MLVLVHSIRVQESETVADTYDLGANPNECGARRTLAEEKHIAYPRGAESTRRAILIFAIFRRRCDKGGWAARILTIKYIFRPQCDENEHLVVFK